jgi:hypothetical protein
VTVPSDSDVLAGIEATFPGWRAWRTQRGLCARQGGSPPAGPHASGDTPAGLLRAIEHAISHPPGRLSPAEQAALDALRAAGVPQRIRDVSDASGLAMPTATRTLAGLWERELATRRRDGRAWLYSPAVRGGGPP